MNSRSLLGFLVLYSILLAATMAAAAPEHTVTVKIDPRVELLGVVYRIGGHPEFSQGQVERYLNDVDDYFAPYRDHPVVALAKELRESHGISFDAVMQMALHLDDAFTPAPIRSLDDESLQLYADGRWTESDARRFIDELADFVRKSDFKRFYEEHAAIYQHTVHAMQSFVDAELDESWLQNYFGFAPGESFTIVPAMIDGPASYGPKYLDAQGKEKFYAIVGINSTDKEGMPVVGADALELIIHEFSHSFVNDLVQAHRSEFEVPAGKIFETVAPAMERMAYPNWQIMVDESLVRAVVIRYLLAHGDTEGAKKRVQYEVKRSFLWMPELTKWLAEYEQNRERYSGFDDYMPRVAAFFVNYASHLDGAGAGSKG